MSNQEGILDEKPTSIFDLSLVTRLISSGFAMGFWAGKKMSLQEGIMEPLASTASYALQITKFAPSAGKTSIVTGKSEDTQTTVVKFEKEKLAFYKLKSLLLNDKRYYGKFVAIVNEQMVDFDSDKIALAKRVYSNKGYVPMYIGKVIEEEPILELPSPELL